MNNILRLQSAILFTVLTMSSSLWAQQARSKKLEIKNSSAVKLVSPEAEGPIDGGGGVEDGKGVTVDSYMKRVDQIRGYRAVVEPVLEGIKNKLPHLHARLLKTIKVSGFYVAPHEILTKLPASKQGIPYDIADFNHAAFNLNDEAWFVEQRMNDKTEHDAGNLLLHEIFMLDFISLTPKSALQSHEQWAELHSKVRRIGGYFRLNPDDDENEVREIVRKFYQNYYLGPYVEIRNEGAFSGIEFLLRTKTEILAGESVRNKFEEEYKSILTWVMQSLYKETFVLCQKIPRVDELTLMSLADFNKHMPNVQVTSDLIRARAIWVELSGELDKSKAAISAKQDILRRIGRNNYGDSLDYHKYPGFFVSVDVRYNGHSYANYYGQRLHETKGLINVCREIAKFSPEEK